MVDIRRKLEEIKVMVDAGDYFAINRARQYGKTTLRALSGYLREDYEVDTATNNQGFYDIRNLKQKIRPDAAH